MNRVVITGVGIVSPYGIGCNPLWKGLKDGISAISKFNHDEVDHLACQFVGQLKEFEANQYLKGYRSVLLDRATQFGLVAATEALENAKIFAHTQLPLDPYKISVMVGTAYPGSSTLEAGYKNLYQEKKKPLDPFTIPKGMANAIASQLFLKYGFKGPSITIANACTSSAQAIGEAWWMISSGRADLAIAGGSDASLNFGVLKAWEPLKAISTDTCRPFSKGRQGMIMGEGAGFIILERLESALARKSPIYAEIKSYAINAEALDTVKPSVDGIEKVMREALRLAKVPAEAIGYVNAHGTGTILNDICEAQAISRVFGKRSEFLPVSAIKSGIGHLMGASSAVELIAGLLVFTQNIIPPTLNFLEQDPACQVDAVPNQPRKCEVNSFIKNALAFGGVNTCIVLSRV
jgi:nodulation protein E